jgi:hypothetical protein
VTEPQKIRRLAERRMEKAQSALRAARKLLDEVLYEDSINRSYYAMFHAVSALLVVRGLERPSTRVRSRSSTCTS